MKKITLNILHIESLSNLHDKLKRKFGFPDFYGENMNALIDCWSSLRYPDDEMTTICLLEDEQLIIELNGGLQNIEVLTYLIKAIEQVNKRALLKGQKPSLVIVFC